VAHPVLPLRHAGLPRDSHARLGQEQDVAPRAADAPSPSQHLVRCGDLPAVRLRPCSPSCSQPLAICSRWNAPNSSPRGCQVHVSAPYFTRRYYWEDISNPFPEIGDAALTRLSFQKQIVFADGASWARSSFVVRRSSLATRHSPLATRHARSGSDAWVRGLAG
jgi:hypothetical protein